MGGPACDPPQPSGPAVRARVSTGTAAAFRNCDRRRGEPLSQLFVESGPLGSSRRLYGPGVQAGYQFVAGGGFTMMASLGLGYAPGVSRPVDGWAGLLGLAAGYTWRRMSQGDLRPMR
jgi:hypothetical protein